MNLISEHSFPFGQSHFSNEKLKKPDDSNLLMRPQARKYHNNNSDVPLEMTSMVPRPVMGLKFADSLDQYKIPNNQPKEESVQCCVRVQCRESLTLSASILQLVYEP